jgi:ComF family protein
MRWSPLTSRALAAVSFAGKCLANSLLPVSCVFCGARQAGPAPVCDGCFRDLPWIPVVQPAIKPLATVATPLEYAFPVDAAIKAMKFSRRLFYGPAFAYLLMKSFDELPEDIDALLPMPLHWRRHAMRGFNQAAEIARPIRSATGLPLVTDVIRHRNTPYQSGLSASQRKRNLESAFLAKGDVSYGHVLVVDDVITTGETCRQLAVTLLDAGVKRVSALAIARALRD